MQEPVDPLVGECFRLARQALENGNEPFGALLAREGRIVLTAENTVNIDGDITRHAELNLVSQAVKSLSCENLSQCVLYSSTEPLKGRIRDGEIIRKPDVIIDEYYEARGWDTNGIPTAATLG